MKPGYCYTSSSMTGAKLYHKVLEKDTSYENGKWWKVEYYHHSGTGMITPWSESETAIKFGTEISPEEYELYKTVAKI